jgi:3-oxoacyl-[acyl-carrier protein] reductase
VSRYDQVEAMVDTAANAYGRLDVLANIAGIIINQTVEQTIEADFDRVMAVNVKGVLFGCKAAIKVMKPQRSGSIINISSQAIDHPVPDTVAYSMSKAAVAQLTRNLAVELGPHGVRVNAIAPGLVVSPMTRRHYTNPDGSVDEQRRIAFISRLAQLSPLHRVGAPEDIAHAILYLASEASRYMTGQILRPNGGSSMPW